MPKTSKETASIVQEFPVATDRSEELDGYTVSFVSITESHDLGPILKNLPTGDCQCPHWGYIVKGRMIVRYDDHEEVCEAGDAFYMSPGHAPEADAGSEFVLFSPTPEFQELQAAIMKVMQG
jgi:hypothetical protein